MSSTSGLLAHPEDAPQWAGDLQWTPTRLSEDKTLQKLGLSPSKTTAALVSVMPCAVQSRYDYFLIGDTRTSYAMNETGPNRQPGLLREPLSKYWLERARSGQKDETIRSLPRTTKPLAVSAVGLTEGEDDSYTVVFDSEGVPPPFTPIGDPNRQEASLLIEPLSKLWLERAKSGQNNKITKITKTLPRTTNPSSVAKVTKDKDGIRTVLFEPKEAVPPPFPAVSDPKALSSAYKYLDILASLKECWNHDGSKFLRRARVAKSLFPTRLADEETLQKLDLDPSKAIARFLCYNSGPKGGINPEDFKYTCFVIGDTQTCYAMNRKSVTRNREGTCDTLFFVEDPYRQEASLLSEPLSELWLERAKHERISKFIRTLTRTTDPLAISADVTKAEDGTYTVRNPPLAFSAKDVTEGEDGTCTVTLDHLLDRLGDQMDQDRLICETDTLASATYKHLDILASVFGKNTRHDG